jgi:hypothetical protein
MIHTDPLTRIIALTDWERRSALCFLAGYAPDRLVAALDEMDRQREAFDAHAIQPTSALQNFVVGMDAR